MEKHNYLHTYIIAVVLTKATYSKSKDVLAFPRTASQWSVNLLLIKPPEMYNILGKQTNL